MAKHKKRKKTVPYIHKKIIPRYLTKPEFSTNPTLINTFIHFYGEHGDINQVYSLWNLLCNPPSNPSPQSIPIESYGAMMKALLANSQPEESLRFYNEVLAENHVKHNDMAPFQHKTLVKNKNGKRVLP